MSSDDTARLSEREQEILLLVARSATNQQIAQDLGISIHTVKVHLRNIFSKIGVSSRTEAAIYALQQGLVQREDSHISEANPDVEATDAVAPAPIHTEETTPADHTPTRASPQPATIEPTASQVPQQPARRLQHRWLILGLAVVCLLLAFGLTYTLLVQPTGSSTAITTSDAPDNTGTPPGERAAVDTEDDSPSTGSSTLAPMSQPLSSFAVASYGPDNQIYVIGGIEEATVNNTVTRYDPRTNLWVEIATKPTPVTRAHAETLRGRIYIPGGEGPDNTVLDTFEAFDPRTRQWETLPPLPEPRSRYALASAEGRLYLFGGWDGQTYRAETFIYDLSLGEWLEGSPLPTTRRYAGATAIEGQIYVVGGEDASGPLRIVERYDPLGEELGVWTPAAPLPMPIATPAVVSVIDNLLVLHPEHRSLFSYTPESDAWIQRPFPDDINVSSRVVVLDTYLYLFGESTGDNPGTLTVYETDLDQYRNRTFIPGVRGP